MVTSTPLPRLWSTTRTPDYKYEMDAPTHEHGGINPSCGGELTLQLRVENNVIEEASLPATAAPSARQAPTSWPTSSPARRSRRHAACRALPRHDPRRAALRGRPGRSGRGRPASGHLAHARPRQVRRARLAHPRTACSRGKLTSSGCPQIKDFDCRAARYGRLGLS